MARKPETLVGIARTQLPYLRPRFVSFGGPAPHGAAHVERHFLSLKTIDLDLRPSAATPPTGSALKSRFGGLAAYLVWQARLDVAPLALTDEAPPHRCLATPARPGYHGNWLSTAPRLQADQDSTPSATTCTSTAPARLTMLVTMARVLGFVVQPVDEGPVDLQFFDGAPPGGPSITRAASASSRPLNSGRPPPISDSGPGQATSSSVTTVSRFSG